MQGPGSTVVDHIAQNHRLPQQSQKRTFCGNDTWIDISMTYVQGIKKLYYQESGRQRNHD